MRGCAQNFPLLTAIGIGVVLLIDEVTTCLSCSTFDLAGLRLDPLDLLHDDLELSIDASSRLIELHQDLERANLELLLINLCGIKDRHASQ